MISQTVRRNFIKFFRDKQHAVISSSSVVPHEDPTLLFTNAGMNQFKDVFLGKNQRDYTRAVTSQKCIRVGGKHNDLDNVGHTTRHLTFFEMLGNFSFGDYFKADAITFAWQVASEVFGLPREKIWATVFREDDEAFELWKQILPESRIVRMDEKDNFWAMGDTGPCGPCSELLLDRGDRYGTARSPKEDLTGERFLEFWNLVFMQFDKAPDGTLKALPKPSIDTGSGLERVVALQTGVDTVFATDIFRSLIAQIENVFSLRYDETNLVTAPAFHVIADHIRSLAFAIADGAQPGNIERGYVLRKILRRAVRYGKNLGSQEPFLAKILPKLVDVMGPDYPELVSGQNRIAEILTLEEEGFFRTLKRGGSILSQVIDKAKQTPLKQITGEEAFKLKDTYGFPLEEILLIAKDCALEVNLESYQLLEEQAKERSRAAGLPTSQCTEESLFVDFGEKHGTCEFIGYHQTEAEGTISALLFEGKFVESLKAGDEGGIILRQTPFYPEKGGQVADTGVLIHHNARFLVTDCQSPYPGVIIHYGKLETGVVIPGEPIVAQVDSERRQKIADHHTATHLLHAALQETLGPHIQQAGSLVDPDRLRFDFRHHKAVTEEELRNIERSVNKKIRMNVPVISYETAYEEVRENKAIKQFFGDKYGSKVRVVQAGDSQELCGGTHTERTGSIGFFTVIKEGSIASGVRRIEAVTGEKAEERLYTAEGVLATCAERLKTSTPLLPEKLEALIKENRSLATKIQAFQRKEIKFLAQELLQKASSFGNTLFLGEILSIPEEELDGLLEDLSSCKDPYLFVFGIQGQDSCRLVIKVSSELEKKGLHAGKMVKELAPYISGTGGGKADMARAGGKDPSGLPQIFALAKKRIEELC